jgi:hypothetical protein
LGAVRLAFATQVPEGYMVMRGILENALYGFYIFKNPKLAKIWLKRDESQATKREVKKKFQIGPILDLLQKVDPELGRVTRILYETSIDFGAHPNEKSLSCSLKKTEEEGAIRFDLMYLTGNPLPIKLCLKSISRIGVACIKIAGLIIPERFKIMGLSDKIINAQRGL